MIAQGQAKQAAVTPLGPSRTQALRIMDQKPARWHRCLTLQKYNSLTSAGFGTFVILKLIFLLQKEGSEKKEKEKEPRVAVSVNCLAAK